MSKIALSSNEAFFSPPDRLAGKKPSSAGRDFHTSVAVVASALHGSHSNELGAGEQAAAVGAATHLLSHPGPLRPGVARNRRYFFGKSHLPASGLGFLGPAGAAAFGFPVYPRSCAGGWREVGARRPRCRNIAETSPLPSTGSLAGAEFEAFPDAGSSAAGLQKKTHPAKGFGRRKPGAAICWWIAGCA